MNHCLQAAAVAAGAAGLALYQKLTSGPSEAKPTARPGMAPLADRSKKRVIMVTGGTGLVGKGIEAFIADCPEAAANESWVYLSSKDGDLRSMEEVKAIFERHQPTHVIHLAAKVGGLFANMAEKVEFYRENVLMNDNVMECCRIYKVGRFTVIWGSMGLSLVCPMVPLLQLGVLGVRGVSQAPSSHTHPPRSKSSCRASQRAFSLTRPPTPSMRPW